jgi:hypothetical protein
VWFQNPRPAESAETGRWNRWPIGSHGCWAHDIEVADIDRDNRIDVITRGSTGCGSQYTRIWFQDAGIAWTARDLSALAGGGEGLAVGDVNGDALPDLVCGGAWLQAPAAPRTAAWLRRAITTPWTTELGAALGDFNQDGRPDIAMIPLHTRGKFAWYEGPVDPATGPWTERVIATNAGSHKLNVADFNLDGRPDLQVALELQEVALFLNQGGSAPSFTKQTLNHSGHNLRVGDVGNDGDIDLFGANYTGNKPVRLWQNNLAMKVATPTITPAGGTFTAQVAVVLASSTTGATVRYTTDGSTPTGASAAGTNVTIQFNTVLSARGFAAGQSDSDVSVAVFTFTDGDLDGLPDWVETGTGVFAGPTNTGTSSTDPDTDDDGRNDFVEVTQGSDPFDPTSFPRNPVADFTGDGRSDIAVYFRFGGDWYIRRSQDGLLRQQDWGWSEAQPAPGDFDGDGTVDVAVYHAAAGDWYILESSNGLLRLQNWGWAAATPVPGDYDGDQRADVAVYHGFAGDWYIQQSGNGQLRLQNWGWADAVPVPADFDGDRVVDIAVYHPTAGNWYVLKSSDGGLLQRNWGWAEALPVPGDYDGDLRADFAVYHQEGGWWYVLKSSSSSLQQTYFGWFDAVAVPADYDGDGRFDIAVYYQAAGNWYILRSTAGYQFQNWGWNAATPVVGP